MERARAVATWVAVACLAGAGTAGAQDVRFESDAAEIELGGRVQLQAATSSCAEFPPEGACTEEVPAVDMFIRRARVTLTARFNDWIEGRLQPEFGDLDQAVLLDAYGRLLFNPAARLTVGHFKRPFDGFELTSSTRILTVERDVDIPGVPGLRAASLNELTTRFRLSAWDVGVMLDGASADGRFHYWAGVFNGRGTTDDGDLNTEKQFVGRGQVTLDVAGEPLDLAAAAALTDIPFTRPSGELAGEYFTAFELWAELGEFGVAGPLVQAGLVFGENPLQAETGGEPDLPGNETLADFLTWQVVGAYRVDVPEGYLLTGVQPVLRLTSADPNTGLDDDRSWAVTPGVQLFLDGRNKVAINWDLAWFEGDLDPENSFKAQYQFHF